MVDEEPTEKQPDDNPQPPADPWPGAETTRFAHGDDTVVADSQAVREPAPAVGEREPAKWSARADVPVGGPRQPAPQEQEWVPDQEPRAWWLPILIGVAVLVLVGLVGLGFWLAVQGTNQAPAPSASASPVRSSATRAPTTPAAPSSPAVLLVPVPALTSIAVDQATGILASQGLGAKVVNQVTDAVPPGIVTGTDPAAGTPVPQGTVVTLIVAAPPPSSPSPAPSSPSPSE